MFTKCVFIAASVCLSTAATALPTKPRAIAAVETRVAPSNIRVLENIIERVQVDALIDQIVSSKDVLQARNRGVSYASIAPTKSRNRS